MTESINDTPTSEAPAKETNPNRRTYRLPDTRVTRDEQAAIRAKAAQANMSHSAYVRHACLHSRITVRKATTDKQAVQQLLRIGNNLNQLAKQANTQGGASYDARALQTSLAALDTLMCALLDDVG